MIGKGVIICNSSCGADLWNKMQTLCYTVEGVGLLVVCCPWSVVRCIWCLAAYGFWRFRHYVLYGFCSIRIGICRRGRGERRDVLGVRTSLCALCDLCGASSGVDRSK